MNYPVYKYNCLLVRDSKNAVMLSDGMSITNENDVVTVIKTLTALDTAPSEELWVIFLNTKRHVIGYTLAAYGSLYDIIIDTRNVFRAAILANAQGIILAHNHPSGDTVPSKEDIYVTETLIRAAKLLGMEVLDHVIIGLDCEAVSMRGAEYVKF